MNTKLHHTLEFLCNWTDNGILIGLVTIGFLSCIFCLLPLYSRHNAKLWKATDCYILKVIRKL